MCAEQSKAALENGSLLGRIGVDVQKTPCQTVRKRVCVCVCICVYIYITIRYYNGSKFDAWATLHSSCDVSFDLSSLNHCLSTKPSPLGHTPRRKPPSCCGSFGWGLVLQEPCAAAPVRDFKFTFQLLITDLHVGLKWQTSSFGCQTPFSLPK